MKTGHELYRSPADKIALETRNGLSQFDETMRLFDAMKGTFAITPEIVKSLHEQAIRDIYICAGSYRTWPVKIRNAKHIPPSHGAVEGLVEEMCDKANDETGWSPIQTSAYLLWRLNWIHPFGGGNGRTSRAVSYLALCVRYGFKIPGEPTIPELLIGDRLSYQDALEDADAAWRDSVLDVSRMEALLDRLLKQQLVYLKDQDQ